jgi:hypothetical protein
VSLLLCSSTLLSSPSACPNPELSPAGRLIGIFVVPISLVGVLRVAAPRSPWARRFYAPDGDKLARSTERWGRIEARRRRVTDLVVGAPAPPSHDGT